MPVSSTALRVNHELGTVQRVLYKLGNGAGETLRRPVSAFRLGQALIRSRQRSRLDVIRLSYNWLFLAGMLRRARARPAVELLDEGIVQQLWSIGFAGDDAVVRAWPPELLDASVVPDVVVLVEAPLALVASRLECRGSRAGRLDRMEGPQRDDALVRGAHLFAELLSDDGGLLGGRPATRLRRIRNASPRELGADVEALVDELASLAA